MNCCHTTGRHCPRADVCWLDAYDDDSMPAEIDFSEGVRGKFYKPDLRLIPPVRLEPEVQDTLLTWATANIELIDVAR